MTNTLTKKVCALEVVSEITLRRKILFNIMVFSVVTVFLPVVNVYLGGLACLGIASYSAMQMKQADAKLIYLDRKYKLSRRGNYEEQDFTDL